MRVISIDELTRGDMVAWNHVQDIPPRTVRGLYVEHAPSGLVWYIAPAPPIDRHEFGIGLAHMPKELILLEKEDLSEHEADWVPRARAQIQEDDEEHRWWASRLGRAHDIVAVGS